METEFCLFWPVCWFDHCARCYSTCLVIAKEVLPCSIFLTLGYSKIWNYKRYVMSLIEIVYFCRHRESKSNFQTNKLQVKHVTKFFVFCTSCMCIWILDSMLYYYGNSCIENSQKVIIKIQCKCILFYTVALNEIKSFHIHFLLRYWYIKNNHKMKRQKE